MQHGFYFDHNRCVKCHACEIACKSWNEVDVGPRWREVVKIESGTFPDVQAMNVSMACMHCGDAPCRTACPVSAITKRADDGNCRRRSRQVHRVRVLHLGVSIQRAAAFGPGGKDGEVQLLPDSGAGASAPPAAGLRGDLSYRSDSFRTHDRARQAGSRVRCIPARVHVGVARADHAGPPVLWSGRRRLRIGIGEHGDD